VVVLNDVTRLRKLERIRSEFVTNVSHELKTPITAIKGYVETLQDGALRDPEEAGRFLGVVARHVDRLNAIIEDLLLLARIEQQEEKAEVALAPGAIEPVLRSAAQACESPAHEKNTEIRVACEPGLEANVNASLLEQAVVNLLDNAVKYSEPGSPIDLGGAREGGEIVISVQDRGCGIAPQHLPRMFERFYRVDKARSRKAGGTGLGLSIVKHIAQAHRGSVSVESAVGKGSIFRIRLPAAPARPSSPA
jgi:two-component system phosphate regulon sensor histidine kinase PhoR